MTASHTLRSGSTQPSAVSAAVSADAGNAYLSALLDGEVAFDEFAQRGLHHPNDAAARATCQRYALIGQVLRGEPIDGISPAPHAFLAGVQARLAHTSEVDAVVSTPAHRASASPSVPLHRPAANDAVFRWKLVSGVASLAAVMAVSWSVLSSAPAGDPRVALEPQPGGLQAVAPVELATVTPAARAVVVNTDQGPVLRDPRLEQLLAEHRHYGGMSALHMPAGFMRDATQPAEAHR